MMLKHKLYLIGLKEVQLVVEIIQKAYVASIRAPLKTKCRVLPLRQRIVASRVGIG